MIGDGSAIVRFTGWFSFAHMYRLAEALEDEGGGGGQRGRDLPYDNDYADSQRLGKSGKVCAHMKYL